MTDRPAAITIQKLARIWSSRRACQITVAIEFEVRQENGCTIYKLNQIQELENR